MDPIKIEQVAVYTAEPGLLIQQLKSMLGLTEWSMDVVEAHGCVYAAGEAVPAHNEAVLWFNHQLSFELELICYLSGRNWHQERYAAGDALGLGLLGGVPFLSHMGYHVAEEAMAGTVARYEAMGLSKAQEVWTESHTNPYLLQRGRHYHYVVFDSRAQLGFDLKLIARLEPAS